MPEGDILHDTAGDCSDKELLTARLPWRTLACSYKQRLKEVCAISKSVLQSAASAFC